MTELLERALILVAVLGVAYGATGWLALRRPRRNLSALSPGLTVLTRPHCHLCDRLLTALRQNEVRPHLVEGAPEELGIRSLPTVLVVGADGEVVARRSGTAALRDLAVLIRLAQQSRP
ncbi:MAG: hypothetical protein ACRDWX_11895 [Acidimicrobiia bacterium]